MKRWLSIIVLVALPAACSQKPASDPERASGRATLRPEKPPCDPEEVKRYLTLRPEAALLATGRICKYPPALQAMLDDLEKAYPEDRDRALAKAIDSSISLLERVCPGAHGVFSDLSHWPPEMKNARLIDGCKVEEMGLASREEMVGADLSRLLLASVLYGWMREAKVPRAREICRLVLGLE